VTLANINIKVTDLYQLGSRDTLQSHGTKGYCDNSAIFLSNLIGFGLDRREGLSPREGEICYFGQSTYFWNDARQSWSY